jgi:hypothetical protein
MTSCGNSLPTFQDNLLVPSSRVKNPRRKLVIQICGLNRERGRWCKVLSSTVPAGDAGGRGVGGSVVTQCYSEASAGEGDNGKHTYI